MFSSNSLYYQESGKAPFIGLLSVFIVGSLVAFFVGIAYVFAMETIAFVGFDLLLTLIYGVILGFGIGLSAYRGKIRNKKVVLGSAIFIGILAGYFVWIFTIYIRFENGGIILNPVELLSIISNLGQEGSWSVLGIDITGGTLYVLWVLEAFVILSMTALVTLVMYGSTPFCENCDEWSRSIELTSRLGTPGNMDSFIIGLESKDYDWLTELKNVDVGSLKKIKVDLLDCPNCSKNHHLNLTLITTDREKIEGKGGEEKEDGQLIVENLELTEHAYQEVIEWSKELNAPPDSFEINN
jgi:hypothetical protein